MKTVEQQIQDIKDHMPETYKSIQARAVKHGREAFAHVRRGLRGEPDCFYAVENGFVMGTPFHKTDAMPTTAYYMVAFGLQSVVIWWDAAVEVSSPAPAPSTPAPRTPADAAGTVEGADDEPF